MRKKISSFMTSKNILIALTVLCCFFIGTSFFTDTLTKPLKKCVSMIVVPVQKGMNNIGFWVYDKYQTLQEISVVLDENKNLQSQIDELTEENNQLKQDSYELNRLRELYELDQQYAGYSKVGARVIEVTTDECHLTAACTIVVKEYVSTITLSENNKFMNVGATGKLIATVGTDTATNKNIVWSSSDNSICSVDQEGNLSAESVGNAVITATAADGSGVTDSCIIRVVNPVTGIEVVPDSLRLFVGDSQKLGVNVYPDNATIKDVVWKSANESIAVVDEDGEVFAISSGKVKITATSQDGNNIKGICWVYVTPRVNISSLRINSKEIYMLTGRTRQLSVIVRPAVNNDSYEWYSSDTGIVTVDGNGVVTTVGPGEAEVYVISDGAGVESSCIVHSLAISRSNITLEQYDRYTLDVIGTDSNITWRSSNPRVCTVSSSGEVIGRKAGIATITAVVNNKTLSCTVRVTSIR